MISYSKNIYISDKSPRFFPHLQLPRTLASQQEVTFPENIAQRVIFNFFRGKLTLPFASLKRVRKSKLFSTLRWSDLVQFF